LSHAGSIGRRHGVCQDIYLLASIMLCLITGIMLTWATFWNQGLAGIRNLRMVIPAGVVCAHPGAIVAHGGAFVLWSQNSCGFSEGVADGEWRNGSTAGPAVAPGSSHPCSSHCRLAGGGFAAIPHASVPAPYPPAPPSIFSREAPLG
jgi:hypothetical protein